MKTDKDPTWTPEVRHNKTKITERAEKPESTVKKRSLKYK